MSACTRAIRALRLAAAALAAILYMSSGAAADEEGTTAQTPVLVELFSSQGCSSCPPAYDLIRSYKGREDLIILSMHVDYWDYIGWEDPYGDPQFTERQQSYARELDQRTVYTPQFMVDGRFDVMGARRGELEVAIARARETGKTVNIEIDGKANRVTVTGPPGSPDPATVWLAVFKGWTETKITAGENAGREIADFHVVHELRRLGEWQGAPLEIPVDLSQFSSRFDGCAIIVQRRATGPVLGVRMVKFGG